MVENLVFSNPLLHPTCPHCSKPLSRKSLLTLNEIPDVALLSREADHRAVGGQPPILSPVLESLPPDLQDEPEVLDAEEGWDPVVGGESGIPGHPGLLAHGQDVPLDSLWEQYH